MTGYTDTRLLAYQLRRVADTANAIRLPFKTETQRGLCTVPQNILSRIRDMRYQHRAVFAATLAPVIKHTKNASWWDRVIRHIESLSLTSETKESADSAEDTRFRALTTATLYEQIAWIEMSGPLSGAADMPDTVVQRLLALSRYQQIMLGHALALKNYCSVPLSESENWWDNVLHFVELNALVDGEPGSPEWAQILYITCH